MADTKSTTKSDDLKPKTIQQSIMDFQAIMPIISKTVENKFFKNKYADLANIQSQIRDDLAKCKIAYTQEIEFEAQGVTKLKTILYNSDGDEKIVFFPLVLSNKPQEIGSAVTYAKRYSLVALLGLMIIGDDDDGNDAEQSPQKPPAPKTPPSKPWATEKELDQCFLLMRQNRWDEARAYIGNYRLTKITAANLKEKSDFIKNEQIDSQFIVRDEEVLPPIPDQEDPDHRLAPADMANID